MSSTDGPTRGAKVASRGDAILSVKHIVKIFRNGSEVKAIDDVSFDVNYDEFICIIGPSGCGKSTLLRIIAGLETADSGQVLFRGEPMTKPSPKITMVFQTFGLLPWKTRHGERRTADGGGRDRKGEAKQRADRYLRMVGLGRLRERLPSRPLRRDAAAGRRGEGAGAGAGGPAPRRALLGAGRADGEVAPGAPPEDLGRPGPARPTTSSWSPTTWRKR